MGKCGGRELNYVSDVDVVFVAEPTEACPDEAAALAAATRLASALLEVPTATDAEGTLWEVDTALRPDGRNGPLVRSLGGHVSYYERWAKTWEFQALVKARPIAGDAELGAAYMKAIARWCGRRRGGRISWRTCRRCAAVWRRMCRVPRRTGR